MSQLRGEKLGRNITHNSKFSPVFVIPGRMGEGEKKKPLADVSGF
jgi:hypothetical protein